MQAATAAAKFGLFAAALAVLATGLSGYLKSSARFSIAHIAVDGNAHVTARDIIARSGIIEGGNIFRFSLAECAAKIEEVPWIRDVRVRRQLPDQIHIEVTERRPFALLLSRELFYVDEEGRVIAQFDSVQGVDTPVITSKALGTLTPGDVVQVDGLARAFEVVHIMNATKLAGRLRISEINVDDPGNIVMIVEQSGTNIILGAGDLEGKLWRLAKVTEAINRDERFRITELEKLDMRFTDIVPARFRDT